MKLSNSEKMRVADAKAIAGGIPSIILMERASKAVAEAALDFAPQGPVVVFCGSGNNGGDGVGAAVYLMKAGIKVRVFLTGNRAHMTTDCLEMERRLNALGGKVEDYDPELFSFENAGVIIDAIFGIGLNKPVSGKALSAIEAINASGLPTVSADIASGVEADTGRILGAAVCATKTITFSLAKPGHFSQPGCTCCGMPAVFDIGIPKDILNESVIGITAIDKSDIHLPRRPSLAHKGDFGKLLIIGGSVGYTGAPTMSACAALRSGAGLVYLGVPKSIYNITAAKSLEAMPFPLNEENGSVSECAIGEIESALQRCTVCAAGPGMGTGAGTASVVRYLLENCPVPLVLDADALNVLSQMPDILKRRSSVTVLTPHDGEFLRMGGKLSGDRVGDAVGFAVEYGCVLVLKGHRTVIAYPDGHAEICTIGSPALAKGGSGDVLTGVIAAMLGQFPVKKAVRTGVYLHALAGEMCAEKLGEYGVLAGDVIEMLPYAEKELIEH